MIADFRQRLMASTLLVGAAACASPAFAQATPPSASPEAAQATAEAVSDAGPQPESEIVVTGSRLARPDLEGSSPIAVVGQQEFQLQAGSANVENVLNDLPQVNATQTSTSNNPGGGTVTVNLRGLGAQRTLVLVNGRRYVSFDVNQIVDLNTIPAALIDRVDVVTGGQSAVYGSDAIAGVVNFIMKKDFSGVQVDGSYDITERGDGQVFNTSVTLGTNFDDGRGNVTLFGNYLRRSDAFAGERRFSEFAASDNGGTGLTFTGGSPSIPGGRINGIAGLSIASGLNCPFSAPATSNNNIDFIGGVESCFNGGTEGYNFNPINYLQVPQERYMISAMGQYEINDHFRPYTELTFINNRVLNQLAATPISNSSAFGNPAEGLSIGGRAGGLMLNTHSPFFTENFQNALQSLDTDGDGFVLAPSFGFRSVQNGPRINNDDRNAYRVLAGLAGDLWGGWDYDASYMYSRTKNVQRQLGNINITNFLAGIQVGFRNPDTGEISATPFDGFEGGGELVCFNEVSGCVPVNIFGENNLSPEAQAFIRADATNVETYSTQIFNATITNNDLFDLGAGGVGVAVGAEWRKEAGAVDPDPQLTSGNIAGFNSGLATSGSYQVREFFGETRIPIIRDSFIHRLELNGAARFTTYSNAPGDVFTWAAGAELAPVRDVTFRGQYQKAIRGPSINELFFGDAVGFPGNLDRCGTSGQEGEATDATAPGLLHDICVAQFTAAGAPLSNIGNPDIQDPDIVNPATFFRGNPDLIEETAKTFTVGAVFTPTFVPRFSATIDYYHIKIDDIILLGGIPVDTIGALCFEQNDPFFCGSFSRNSIGEVETIANPAINGGSLEVAGIDVGAGYNMPLGPIIGPTSRLSFSMNGSRLLKSELIPLAQFPDQIIECAGNFGANCGPPTPKWKHTARVGLTSGPVTISGQWRYIGKSTDDDDSTNYDVEKLPAVSYFDLSTLFDIGEHYQLGLGVSNIFDKKPPLLASAQQGGSGEQSNTFPTVYDVLGRSYFVSGRLKF